MLARLEAVLGPEFVEHALMVDEQRGSFGLRGWVAEPRYNRAQADRQFFFVNGRVIRDRLVAHAIRQSFRDVLFHGRHPAFVLFLELPFAAVWMSMSIPQKHEVRFRDSRAVHDFIFSTLNRSLAAAGVGGGALRPGSDVQDPAYPGQNGAQAVNWDARQAPMPISVAEQIQSYAQLVSAPRGGAPGAVGGTAYQAGQDG